MFDGVKIYYRLKDFRAWKKAVNIDLYTQTDLETGAVKTKIRSVKNGDLRHTILHRGGFETYQVTVKETIVTKVNGNRIVTFFLIIDGSFHKNHFNGANYLPFSWDSFQTQINYLEAGLQLNPDLMELVNLEIGVNIITPFEVFTFLQRNLIAFKGHSFNRYNPDKNGLCLGYVCPLRQYSVKAYDKGIQFDLPDYLMRFELRYIKMQKLKERGIKCLTDLKSLDKVNSLLSLLLSAWDNVLLFDHSIDLENSRLKLPDLQLLREGRRPGFWLELKDMNTRSFNYQRVKFRELVSKHGEGWHGKIRELIKLEWAKLFNNCTILPSVQNCEGIYH
jgi:hypothetical protein